MVGETGHEQQLGHLDTDLEEVVDSKYSLARLKCEPSVR